MRGSFTYACKYKHELYTTLIMSTIDEGPEQDSYQKLTPLDRYYNNICDDTTHGTAEAIIAIESLFEAEHLLDEDTDRESLRSKIIHMAETAKTDQERKERYLIAPITMLAPYIELTRSPKQVRKWYEDAVEWTLLFAEPDHDLTCITEQEGIARQSCSRSTDCPVVETVIALVDPVFVPDFEDFAYTIDPKQAHDVAKGKLLTARSFGLGDKQLMNASLNNFEREFAARYSTVLAFDEPEKQA